MAAPKLGYFWRHHAFLHTTRSFEEANYFNPTFWSLSVEFEFYILQPLLALLGRRLTQTCLRSSRSFWPGVCYTVWRKLGKGGG